MWGAVDLHIARLVANLLTVADLSDGPFALFEMVDLIPATDN
jgi:hypothetical protein